MHNIAIWCLFAILIILIQGERPTYTLITSIPDLNDGEFAINTDVNLANNLMLGLDQNMIIFGPDNLKSSVLEKRKEDQTVFIPKDFQQISKHWTFTYLKKLAAYSQRSSSNQESPQFKRIAMETSKLFLMFQALEQNKFDTKFFLWIDEKVLNQNADRILRPFYSFVQPRWLFFTKQSNDESQMSQNLGEQRYINRRLKKYQQVNPSFMGGSVDILKDIKSAYQSFLRVLFEQNLNNFEKNRLSLLPIRYPSLIPNTVSISLDNINNKIHEKCQLYRLPTQQRFFSISFHKDGTVNSNDGIFGKNFSVISNNQVKTSISQENTQDNQLMDGKLSSLINGKHFYLVAANLLELLLLITLIIGYIIILAKTIKIKSLIRLAKPKIKSPSLGLSEISITSIDSGRVVNREDIQIEKQ